MGLTIVSLTSGYTMYQSEKSTNLSSIAMRNIEALANGEDNDEVCEDALDSSCTYIVVEPGKNHSETYYDMRNITEW